MAYLLERYEDLTDQGYDVKGWVNVSIHSTREGAELAAEKITENTSITPFLVDPA